MLSSLKELTLRSGYNLLPVGESHVGYQFPVEVLWVDNHGCSGKELTRLLSCFPRFTKLDLLHCWKLTGLGVLEQNTAGISTSTSLDEKMNLEGNEQLQREVELELSTTEEGLVLLPPQLQELGISQCQGLRLHPNTVEEAGGWLQGLRSLRSLVIRHSDKFLSYYSSSSSPGGFPFPASLRNLNLNGVETPVPLSNLTSLESLYVYGYSRGSRAEKISLWPLLTQGCLTKLSLYGTPIFFVGPDPEASWSHHGQGLPPRLGEIETNDVGGILATPICSLLSSSLTKLVFLFG